MHFYRQEATTENAEHTTEASYEEAALQKKYALIVVTSCRNNNNSPLLAGSIATIYFIMVLPLVYMKGVGEEGQ